MFIFCALRNAVLTCFFFFKVSVNLLAEIVPGALLPGNPLANMVFKAYSVQTLQEASAFVQDLKLSHYVKVPPRATFVGASFAPFSWPHSFAHLTCSRCSASCGHSSEHLRADGSEDSAFLECQGYMCYSPEGRPYLPSQQRVLFFISNMVRTFFLFLFALANAGLVT